MESVCGLTTAIQRNRAEEITQYTVITPGREIEVDPEDESLEFIEDYRLQFMVGVIAYPPNRTPIFYKMNLVWIGHDF